MSTQNLAVRFQHQPPRDDADVRAHQRIRGAISQTAHVIDAVAPDGREKATALTKLEEAMMWANAAIARGGTADAPKPKPGDGGPLAGTERVLASIDDAIAEAIRPLPVTIRDSLAEQLDLPTTRERLEQLQREQLKLAKAKLSDPSFADLAEQLDVDKLITKDGTVVYERPSGGILQLPDDVTVTEPAPYENGAATRLARELEQNNGLAVIGLRVDGKTAEETRELVESGALDSISIKPAGVAA